MKNKIIKSIIATGVIAGVGLGLTACGNDKNNQSNNNEVAQYYFYNCETTYNLNEYFSLEGAKLKITLFDGTVKEVTITNSMIKQMPDMSTPGSKAIIIEYDGREYVLTINVIINEVSYTVTGYNSTYSVGDDFDLSNLYLSISMADGSIISVKVTANMIETMPNMQEKGLKVVVINYGGKQYTFDFDVLDTKQQDMLNKLEQFKQDLNNKSIKSSKITLHVDGAAKYLDKNAELNEEIFSLLTQQTYDLQGAQVYKTGADQFVIYKEFDTVSDLYNFYYTTSVISMSDVEKLIFVCNCPAEHYYALLSKEGMDVNGWENYENFAAFSDLLHNRFGISNLTPASFDDIKNIVVNRFVNFNENNVIIDTSYISKTVYESIINAIVKTSLNVRGSNILQDSGNNLKAKLDMLKIMQNSLDNLSNIENVYDFLINDVLLTEKDSFYVDMVSSQLCSMAEIRDENTVDELNYLIRKDIKNLRERKFTNLTEVLQAIVEINDVLQSAPDGNRDILSRLDIIVDGLDAQNPNMVSDFIYSFKELVSIVTVTSGQTNDPNDLNVANRHLQYTYDGTYYYYDVQTVSNSEELVEKYFSAVKNLLRGFESIDKETNLRELFNSSLSFVRQMNEVNKEIQQNNYKVFGVNIIDYYPITTQVEEMLRAYVSLYDAEIIADIFDQIRYVVPQGSSKFFYENSDMAPDIQPGAAVIVMPSESYNVDEIVAFYDNGNLKIHKIVNVRSDGGVNYYTCKANTASENDQEIAESAIIGKVVKVSNYDLFLYLRLPEDTITLLSDCADIIYEELAKPEPDYLKIIDEICEKFNVKKEEYANQFNNGEFHLFADVFDSFMDLDMLTGEDKEFFTTVKTSCQYLDSLFVEDFNRTELLNQINALAKGLAKYTQNSIGQYSEVFEMIANLSDTQNNIYTNIKNTIKNHKTFIKNNLQMLTSMLGFEEGTEAKTELDNIIDYYINAYIHDEFNLTEMVKELTGFVNEYCDENVVAVYNPLMMLTSVLAGSYEDIDYNELFKDLELPREIKEIDFNKLVNETLKDKDTYNFITVDDVIAEYITDENGEIIKEVITVKINSDFNILISSLTGSITLSMEIEF